MPVRSAIYFRSVEPSPCEFIPGGTTCENVLVDWEVDPIGTIVSRPSDKPPDPLSWGRVRTFWYFVPWGRDYPILTCDTVVEALRKQIQDFHRGIYDLRNAPRGTSVASGDDDQIESLVLKWSGMLETWDQWERSGEHSFYREVLRYCPSVILRKKEWEDGAPGLSDTWFSVRTRHPAKLKQEIVCGIHYLIDEDTEPTVQRKTRTAPRVKKPSKG